MANAQLSQCNDDLKDANYQIAKGNETISGLKFQLSSLKGMHLRQKQKIVEFQLQVNTS
jgi:hypothetical protein